MQYHGLDASPDYDTSQVSSSYSLPPMPSHMAGVHKPPVPCNAVVNRPHPPLSAGDYDNNRSRGMYWWEKLDVQDAEEARILTAMYYGEERKPRCNVCTKRNRACMSFLGEESQSGKSCVKCRRVHATCKPTTENGGSPSPPDTPLHVSHKRKSVDGDEAATEPLAKRTRSSFGTSMVMNAKQNADGGITIVIEDDDDNDDDRRQSIARRYKGKEPADLTCDRVGSTTISSVEARDDSEQCGGSTKPGQNVLVDEQEIVVSSTCGEVGSSSTYRNNRDTSISATVGRDVRPEQDFRVLPEDSHKQFEKSYSRIHSSYTGLELLEQGLKVLVQQHYMTNIRSIETAHEANIRIINDLYETKLSAHAEAYEAQLSSLQKEIASLHSTQPDAHQAPSSWFKPFETRLLSLEKDRAGLGGGDENTARRLEERLEREKRERALLRRQTQDENFEIRNRIVVLESNQKSFLAELRTLRDEHDELRAENDGLKDEVERITSVFARTEGRLSSEL